MTIRKDIPRIRRGEPAVIEIVERLPHDQFASVQGRGLIRPNEIRINGTPVECPLGMPITVHDLVINGDGDPTHELVKVTLTVWARVVRIEAEDADAETYPVEDARG